MWQVEQVTPGINLNTASTTFQTRFPQSFYCDTTLYRTTSNTNFFFLLKTPAFLCFYQFIVSHRKLPFSSIQAFKANFLTGQMDFLRSSFNVFRLASLGDRALRIARVFFGRKSSGLNFFPRYKRRKFSFVFWCITMYTRAMALRTTRLNR